MYFFFQNKLLGKSLNLKSGPVAGSFLFGTPSYPSPLDRIRPTKKDRAAELGLSTALQDSLDLNATFPKAYKPKAKLDEHNMDVFKPNRNLDQISSEFKNKFFHQWILQMFTFSQKNIFHVFVLFQKIAYMYPLTEGVLVWTWPHPSSSSALYFPLKVLACKTSYPLGTSSGLPWARFEYFMEKHISVPTVCCFFKLLNLFLYIILFTGDSLHSFSYSPGHCRGSFLPTPADPRLSSSWQFYNFVGGAGTGAVFPTTVRNPVCTLIPHLLGETFMRAWYESWKKIGYCWFF